MAAAWFVIARHHSARILRYDSGDDRLDVTHRYEEPAVGHAEDILAQLVGDLGRAVHRNRMDRIRLIAPGPVLTQLRRMMDLPTRAAVSNEHDEDITELSRLELHARLREISLA